jgi:biopolymer transport protein ExbD
MRLPKPRPLSPAIPAAALADVALLLVFFFLLATRFAPDAASVTVPRAPGLHEAAPGAVSIVVQRRTVAGEGSALLWRVETGPGDARDLPGPEALYFEASRIVDKDPERTFLLRIDGAIRFAVVDDVLETLRKAGVRNVVLGADPAAGGA